MAKPLLTIASGNPRKVAEIEAMLGPLPIDVQRQPQDLDVEETGSTYLDNALLKARAVAKRVGNWTIADDSGLEVDALDGAPGLYSARFAASNQEKIKKILAALENNPYRSARFRSVMVLCNSKGKLLKAAEGICWGELLRSPAYEGGEFESLFWVREANCTYGELNNQQLSRLGSRGKAARALAPCLREQLGLDQIV
ncbi:MULTISPECIES: non-canonical purine NTP pyrophosphatase [Prochlorococcus]|uniref:non-canonical purine NTP pyrophosphatase n=1 Tax=Prochlorococcus TaxID=1218 RepID=UPI00059E9EEF|nr:MULTISPECIES: non-canonical purine NTP pyrophosphatase [Prochlorococcus]MEC7738144.1 non-canonical purine NTP pyrophosphatase [Cyanobacteriota bacterium]MED5263875.1 non-canonical purine NTP pyrophosphatase [Cyanobacteriota bacterium]MED5561880.1 non-canonical purine NTP pyrophosphatase [Cyanobacteriota bacterium]NMO83736.1 non-canonical purine NTP pyrophosphatase [Prochlorococcus sp. P1344]NMP14505.1 non-canonical purine NTP pyrophosphatase [Prochlorococcus sp.P1363]